MAPVSKTGVRFPFLAPPAKYLVNGVWIRANQTQLWLQPERRVVSRRSRRPFSKHRRTLWEILLFWQRESLREGRKGEGRGYWKMGKDFLTEPGAATVRKDFFFFSFPAAFRGTLRPKRDFISQSAGTGRGSRRLFPEKRGKKKKKGGSGESRGKKERERGQR